MFCTMDSNFSIDIPISHHHIRIFYKKNLSIFHMIKSSNFYNILQMDNLIRMINFLLGSKKIIGHMINIQINYFLHRLSKLDDKANKFIIQNFNKRLFNMSYKFLEIYYSCRYFLYFLKNHIYIQNNFDLYIPNNFQKPTNKSCSIHR